MAEEKIKTEIEQQRVNDMLPEYFVLSLLVYRHNGQERECFMYMISASIPTMQQNSSSEP